MAFGYGRFDASAQNGAVQQRIRFPKFVKPRQEICALLKWFCFSVNCVVFLCGVTLLALGVYLWVKDPRSVTAIEDVVLNPAVVLVIGGLFVSLVALAGLFGSLRDNSSLLKASVWSSALGYVALVLGVFGLFFVFFADSADILSMNSILTYAIQKYHTNHNMADFVDYVQENLECCGIRSLSQGYRDWHMSEQFHCNQTNLFANPFPERCGVPFSCCKKNQQPESASGTGSLLPAMRSLQCWQNAQTKRPQDLENDLYIRGCMTPLRQAFESHAVLIGSTVAMTLVPGLFYIFMEYVLARQIDYQHYLLGREARRNERRRRREVSKVTAMEMGTASQPTFPKTTQPITTQQKVVKERKSRRATTSAPPISRKQSDDKNKQPSNDRKPSNSKQNVQKPVGQKPKIEETSKKDKRRGRSSAPTTQLNPAADPTGKVRHWILQQSDFIQPKKDSK